MFKPKNLSALLLSLSLILPSLLSPLASAASYNSSLAQTYLTAHADNAWSVMGLAALGQNPSVDFLKAFSGSAAIDFAAPILALTAAGKDPRTFTGSDLVAKLKSFHIQNQLGDVAAVNDDIFGLLALISAGEPTTDATLKDAKNFILARQNPDGGWGFQAGGSSDSNMTAAAIVALKAAGLQSSDPAIAKALDYIKSAQNGDGGFTYDPQSKFGTASDSSSTAWVLWALNALNLERAAWSKNGHNPDEYLASTQTQNGYFEYQAGAGENSFSAANTAYAVIALAGKTLPLKISTPVGNGLDRSLQFPFRIEGSQDTLCEGQTQGPTALDIVKNAAALCGFSYHIKDTSFGPYLDKIGEDEAGGATGWLYWVNFNSPDIGAADFKLNSGDEVLWAFGNFDVKPLRLTLAAVGAGAARPNDGQPMAAPTSTEIQSGGKAEAIVEYMDNGAKPLEGSKVFVGTADFTTNSQGAAQIAGPDGYYQVAAKKAGFVRSNKILLKIGNPASSTVNLSVDVARGQVGGTSTPPSTLAFTIEPNFLDFGTLNPGASAKRTLKLKNTGSVNLQFESEVTAGQLFKDNLKLDGKRWRQFKKDVAAQLSQDVEASLTIPGDAQAGKQTGMLVFWAISQ